MTVESATYLGDLVPANPGYRNQKKEGDDHIRLLKSVLQATFPGLAGGAWRVQPKTGTYTALATDNMTVIVATGALTLNLTAAATLGNKWLVAVFASGGAVTIDPNSSEVVNGAATLVVPQNSWALLFCENDTSTPMHFRALVNTGNALLLQGGSVAGTVNLTGASAELRLYDKDTSNGYNGIFRNANYLRISSSLGDEEMVMDDSGNVTFDGNVSAYSDERLKEQVHNIMAPLAIVGQLRGVHFVWKEGNGAKSGKKDYGFIAQEVEKILPEIVLESAAKDQPYLTVDYTRVVPILAAALSELHRNFMGLQASHRALREELDAVKARLEKDDAAAR